MIVLRCVLGTGLILLQSGCTIGEMFATDKGNRLGAGAPELNADGKFSDSEYNRQFFHERVDRRINMEKYKSNPDFDYERSWRVSFRAINKSSENPEYKKNYIIAKRRKAGLPIWPFMLE
jgi:hypothetical protein